MIINETTSTTTEQNITIYTDGSCLHNPGPGGWAAIILRENRSGVNQPQEISGGISEKTTNNRMEMSAVIEALKTLEPIISPVTIISDSNLVIQGMTEWLEGWKAKGWKNSKKKPVENRDLWENLDSLNSPLITWKWVKGHAGNKWNERADILATTAAQQAATLYAA